MRCHLAMLPRQKKSKKTRDDISQQLARLIVDMHEYDKDSFT